MADEEKEVATPEETDHTSVQTIDSTSLLQGYLVGCRLRSARGK